VKRTQEWLLFGMQLIVKMGFLGKYKLVSVDTLEQTKANQSGLKTLEKTIISLGKKNDVLVKKNTEMEQRVSDLLTEKSSLSIMVTQASLEASMLERENKKYLDDYKQLLNEKVEVQQQLDSMEREVILLQSMIEEATTMSERLQGEMIKWRT